MAQVTAKQKLVVNTIRNAKKSLGQQNKKHRSILVFEKTICRGTREIQKKTKDRNASHTTRNSGV